MYKSSEVDDLEKQESPGRAVVNDWIQKQNPTLEMLVRKLDEVERKDMMYELEKITKYKCPGLNSSIPVVEDSLPTQQGGDEKPPVDEQTALKMGPDKFYPDSNDTYQDWEQTPNEGLDISIKLKKESDKTFEPTGYDTGYNTSASSSESDRNDSSLESKISDSSLEVDGPITMNRDDTNYPGMKMRYTPTTSGKLAMTVVSSKDEIPLDKEGTSFMDRNQRIIRQESMESYRGPVQTEPSMNSNQFINLKQERHVQDVRPKTCSPKVTMTPVAQEADQVPSSQQQVVPLENYVKLHTEEAPTLQDISSFGDTMDDFRDEMMSSHPRISDVEFNSARPETETSISTEYGFFPLDLSSMTSENSDVASNACHNNVEEHCLELAVSQDSLNYANGSPLKEYPCCGGDLEVANISSKNHSAGFDLRVEELTASWTDSSVPSTGNNDSLTELKRRQNRYPQANLRSIGSIGNDSRIAELPNGVCDLTETNRGNDNPQSGSLSSLTSLGIGLAAGVLMVAAYNKFK